MIDDKTNGYIDEVKAFAERTGRSDQLQGELDYLSNYGGQETRCVLYKDFAPMSFYFEMQARKGGEWKHWFNGGLIFFSDDDTGVGAPQFSVRLGPDLSCGWSIHT